MEEAISLRPRIDTRFAIILTLSAVVVGGTAVSFARYRLAPAGVNEHADRIATVQQFVREQEERPSGTRAPRAARYAIRANGEAPHLTRQQPGEAVANRGIFAALGAPAGGSPQAGVVSPFGGMAESGNDTIGDAFGNGGLGVVGTGLGGGGQGYGSGAGTGLRHRGPQGRMGNRYAGNSANFGVEAPADAAMPTLDPNGRFATTYRPGRGHLSWFESAIARGEIPEGSRELLAEMAPSAAEGVPAPTAGALGLQWDLERSALNPSGGALRLRIALRSADSAAIARPTMSIHLVMDTSGSMEGDSIVHAREAAHALVTRLADGDHFSLTAFDSEARVVVREGLVGPRRASIQHAIDGLVPGGGTNISDGLSLGYQMAASGPSATDANRVVMLLSDGEATDGETRREALAAMAAHALQDGTETSSFGVGTSYDGSLMSQIAEWGAGGYYYIPDSTRIATAFATELQDRTQPVAQAVEVRVRLADGVTLNEVYGSRRLTETESNVVRTQEVALDQRTQARDHIRANRQTDHEGGMRFFIPGFARNDQHVMLLGVTLPAGVGERAVASVELRYKDRLLGRNVTTEQAVRARYGASVQESAASQSASVARTIQAFDAGVSLTEAAGAVALGDRGRAGVILAERVAILRRAAAVMHAPELTAQADRLARVERLVAEPASSATMLSMLLDASGRGMIR